MCLVWISEQTAIISLYNINWLVFITQTQCVNCAVRTGSVNVTYFHAVCQSCKDHNSAIRRQTVRLPLRSTPELHSGHDQTVQLTQLSDVRRIHINDWLIRILEGVFTNVCLVVSVMHFDLWVRCASRRRTDGRTVRCHEAVRREDAVDTSSCNLYLEVIHVLCHVKATWVRSVYTRRRHLMYLLP